MKLAIRGRYMRPRRFYIDGELLLHYEQHTDGDYIVLKVDGEYEAGRHLLRMENDDGQYAEAYFTLEGLGIGRPTPLETGQSSKEGLRVQLPHLPLDHVAERQKH